MKLKYKVHYKGIRKLSELTNIVTLLTIIGSFMFVCSLEIIGIVLLIIAFVISFYICGQYHISYIAKIKKEMLKQKLFHVKRKHKHLKKHGEHHGSI